MAANTIGILFFVQYVILFVALAILVKLSQPKHTAGASGNYSYNTTLVVFMVEIVKLVVASAMAVYTYSFARLVLTMHQNYKLLLLYFVPSVLYAFHNNLMFYSMRYLDPATYYVLLQFRVIATGVIFQILFKKYLNRTQWLALFILFVGCLLKELDRYMVTTPPAATKPLLVGPKKLAKITPATVLRGGGMNTWVILVVLFQVFCSCGAAVYTEYLLKSAAESANVHLQNMFMYMDSILCNVGVLYLRALYSHKGTLSVFSAENFTNLLQPCVLAIICVSAAGGLTTAFLLKYLDSVLKIYANSFEIVLTAICSYFILGIRISALSYVALFTVCGSLYLYRRVTTPEVSVASRERKDEV